MGAAFDLIWDAADMFVLISVPLYRISFVFWIMCNIFWGLFEPVSVERILASNFVGLGRQPLNLSNGSKFFW